MHTSWNRNRALIGARVALNLTRVVGGGQSGTLHFDAEADGFCLVEGWGPSLKPYFDKRSLGKD